MDPSTHPLGARLDDLLSGREAKIIRPAMPAGNPRHDMYGPRPDTRSSIEDMLGSEHFSKPVRLPEDEVMYSIGELGKILGRKAGTIRMWIRTGVIPEADHWSAGEGNAAKRQFSKSQVMGLLSLASTEGLLETPRRDISKTGFSARAWDLWAELS